MAHEEKSIVVAAILGGMLGAPARASLTCDDVYLTRVERGANGTVVLLTRVALVGYGGMMAEGPRILD